MKRYTLTLFVVFGSFLIIGPLSDQADFSYRQSKNFPALSSHKKQVKKSPAKKEVRIKRAPASVKTPQGKTRAIIARGNYDLSTLKYSNKVNPNWKEDYRRKFLRMSAIKKVQKLKIESIKSIVKIKNNTARNLEHIKVSYLQENGDPFSFEALVDSETGSLIRSWNKTRYEFKKSISFNPKGHELYRE